MAALILLFAAPLIPLFMAIVGWRAKAASEEQLVQLGGMNAFLLDRLRGLSTLRAFGAVEATGRQLHEHAQSLRVRTMRVLRIAFLSSAVLELFSALGVAMVAVYIGFHLLGVLRFGAWGQALSLGQALFVLLLTPAFFEPLRELSAVWHDRAAGEAALERLQAMAARAQPLVGDVRESEAARLSNQELAERIGLSPSPCSRRVKQLEDDGYISRQVALLDRKMLGLSLTAYVLIGMDRHTPERFENFEAAIRSLPQVLECSLVTGMDADYQLKVVVPDMDHYQKLLLGHLTRIDGVTSVRSSFVLNQVLNSTELPLTHLRT